MSCNKCNQESRYSYNGMCPKCAVKKAVDDNDYRLCISLLKDLENIKSIPVGSLLFLTNEKGIKEKYLVIDVKKDPDDHIRDWIKLKYSGEV